MRRSRKNQCEALYIINFGEIAYHQNEVLYIIKPTNIHTYGVMRYKCGIAALDDIQPDG